MIFIKQKNPFQELDSFVLEYHKSQTISFRLASYGGVKLKLDTPQSQDSKNFRKGGKLEI